jgi:tRNA 2-selenouridine synthase
LCGTFYFPNLPDTFVFVNYSRLHIEAFLQQKGLLLDVRSPSEYAHAAIPGAVSFPLFTDEERKIVGTTYKQKSREDAIKIGLDLFGPKMRPMIESVEALLRERNPSSREISVYCWRGGMRSAAVAWLLSLYGFKVSVLIGGYKAFRHQVLKTFEQPYSLVVLGGYTGSGKTELLQYMKTQGKQVIDLEGLACHKGSAFGKIGMPEQPTQELFENRLFLALNELDPTAEIWVEDESQRIGAINIPGAFWQSMRQSPLVFLDIPFEERLDHIIAEYGNCETEILRAAIERITKRLGGLETKNALAFLEEHKIKECFAILLKYYDKYYLKGLHNRDNLDTLLSRIPVEKVWPENATLLSNKLTVT